MDRATHYTTADGTAVPTPRRIHVSDAFTVASYLGMRVFDAITDTANLGYAMFLSNRDALDEATAFLRDGLQEIEVLVSSKFLTSPDEYGAAIQQGIEDGYEAFEGEDDE